jgi:hypothetical protein
MPVCASIESPYSAPTAMLRKRNQLYAMAAQEWAVRLGYAPYASHLIQTTHAKHWIDTGSPYVSDSSDEYAVIGRQAALELSNQLRDKMDICLLFTDYGYSSGMRMAKERFEKAGKEVREVELSQVFPERFYEIEGWVATQDAYAECKSAPEEPTA